MSGFAGFVFWFATFGWVTPLRHTAVSLFSRPSFVLDVDVFAEQRLAGQLHSDVNDVRRRLPYMATTLHEGTRLRATLTSNNGGIIPEDSVAWANKLGVFVRVDCATPIGAHTHISCSGTGRSVISGHIHHISRASQAIALDLTYSDLDDNDLRELVAENPYYEELYLDSTNITDAGMVHLRGLTRIRVLSLSTNNISDAGIAQLSGLTSLQELDLGHTNLGDRGLATIAKLPNIQKLTIAHTKTSGRGLVALRAMRTLQWLAISAISSDAGISHIASLPALRGLSIEAWRLSDRDERALGSMRALEMLSLTTNERGNVASEIARLVGLRSLTLRGDVDTYRGDVFTDTDMAAISRLPALAALELGGTEITDVGLGYIAALPNLRSLDVSNLPTISARGIDVLLGAKGLVALEVGGYAINTPRWFTQACQRIAKTNAFLRCYGAR